VQGFAVSHEPSPWIGDYASMQIMPVVGKVAVAAAERAQAFRHDAEVARAHYYRVTFAKAGITTELTPTKHGAVFRFTFPATDAAHLVFDALAASAGEITADVNGGAVFGYLDVKQPRLYFFAALDRPLTAATPIDNQRTALRVTLSTRAKQRVEMKIATSYLSVDQARANLAQEIGTHGFDDIRKRAQRAWDELLGRVEVEGASEAQKITLYSNLYRAFLYPNTMAEEVGAQIKHFSPYNNQVCDGPLYVNNGFWDTYRAAWPLYILLFPETAGRMLDGIVSAYKEGGWLPRWTAPGYANIMVGTHADAVLADAYLKGVRGFDAAAAYDGMLKDALVYSGLGGRGRNGSEHSIFRGFVALEDTGESAAWQLEDSINDFAIARMAEALGDGVHARYFRARAASYAKLFDAETGFFRGRHADGRFRTTAAEFHADEWGHEFTEGCAWHYVAAASHDPAGMAALYGGADRFADKLEAVLAAPSDFLPGSYGAPIHEMLEGRDSGMGQYAHPNEPVQHMLYMFDYAGRPWRTQETVREVLSPKGSFYSAGVGDGRGYLGDEDNGQMSAWYVFSALGLYPASPLHGEYVIGSPLFRRMKIMLESGKTLEVIAHDNADDHPYVQSATWNGEPHPQNFLTHAELANGGVLELQMGPKPSTWGARPEDRASSLTPAGATPAPLVDCARGGTASVEPGTAAAVSGAERAFDDDSGTKLSLALASKLTYRPPEPCAIDWYTVTSADGAPEHDPRAWRLEGTRDDKSWELVDERKQEAFRWRRQTRVFEPNMHVPYRAYRLNVTRSAGGGDAELAEFELLRSSASPAR
jgi:predicted alpha-1,2-mannosidase